MKRGPIILLITFIVCICCPCIIWFIAGDRSTVSNLEKRKLASMPQLSFANYDIFLNEFENYFNDHLPCRDVLISIDTNLNYYLFHQYIGTSESGGVIVGKENWLFLGGTVDDYLGKNLLSEDELENIKNNCKKIQNDLQMEGSQFVILVAPNKSRMYSEFMPEQYGVPADYFKTLQVIKYLRENTDIQIIYPYDELIDAKESIDNTLYYKTDTHWNNIGSYVGTRALLQELDIDIPDISSDQLKIKENGYHNGDLAQMMNMTAQLNKIDHDYLIEGYDTHNIQELSVENAQAYTSSNSDERRVYMCHDSFGYGMIPYIGSQFSYTYFKNKSSYSYDDFKKQQTDIFIYEVVERNISNLATFTIYK